jgi:ABC-type multidrug transport system fused ATPase/permease subunit
MRSLPEADPGQPDDASPLRYLLWVARSQWNTVLGGASLAMLWTGSQALMPPTIGQAIDKGVLARDGNALLLWAGVLLGLGVVQATTGIMRHRFTVTNWLGGAYRTVQVVTRQATRLGSTLSKRLTTGEVVSVGIADISKIGDAMEITGRGSGAVSAIVLVSALLVWMEPLLGLVVVAGVPVIIFAAAPLLRPMHRRQQRARELTGELTTRAADIVAGLRVLRGVGGERVFSARYRQESQRVRFAGVEVARAESRLSGAEILLPGLLIALVTWLGAHFALDGRISIGRLVAFYGLAVALIEPMRTIGEAADKLTKAHVSAGRIIRILRLRPETPGDGNGLPGGDLDLVDSASGLSVRQGELVALVAAEPADAQTIASRLGGYPAPGEPAVYGGVPVPELSELRRRVLVAINEDRLFTGPLRRVIGGTSGIHAACAEDIVDAVGLDSQVAEGGREFSGGQQQRLRLARALAYDPEVLVLVEPTSAVDAHTEARIASRLGAAREGRTTLICTTSPLVLDRVDRVVYVEGGRVVAEGTHRSLVSASPSYAATVTREDLAPLGE